jgi:hypothetical protein
MVEKKVSLGSLFFVFMIFFQYLYIMKQKNRKLLDLIEVYETFGIYEIIGLIDEFDKCQDEFLNLLTVLYINQNNYTETRDIVERINDELNNIEYNIRVLEDAILCHETKITETRNSKIIGVIKFNLN